MAPKTPKIQKFKNSQKEAPNLKSSENKLYTELKNIKNDNFKTIKNLRKQAIHRIEKY